VGFEASLLYCLVSKNIREPETICKQDTTNSSKIFTTFAHLKLNFKQNK